MRYVGATMLQGAGRGSHPGHPTKKPHHNSTLQKALRLSKQSSITSSTTFHPPSAAAVDPCISSSFAVRLMSSAAKQPTSFLPPTVATIPCHHLHSLGSYKPVRFALSAFLQSGSGFVPVSLHCFPVYMSILDETGATENGVHRFESLA